MSAATGPVPDPPTVHGSPQFGGFVKTGFTCDQGWHLMRNASGLFQVAIEGPGQLPGGFVDRKLALAAAGDDTDLVNVRIGRRVVPMLAGDTFTAADGPRPIYAVNNFDFGRSPTSSLGVARSIAGLFICLDDEFPTTKCVAIIGPEGAAAAAALATPTPVYNAVVTTIAAFVYTAGDILASVAGAIGAQDTGVTLVAGNRVLLPLVTGGAGAGTVTAAMTGPWLVVSPGGSDKFHFVRPPEWKQGDVITPDYDVKIDNVGTKWGGSTWRALPATNALLIGTGDPAFWPRLDEADLTVAGAVTNLWIRNVNRVAISNITGAHAGWLSTLTAGAGTGAATVTGTSSEHWKFLSVNW